MIVPYATTRWNQFGSTVFCGLFCGDSVILVHCRQMGKNENEKNKPATLGDLETWGGNLAFQVKRVEDSLNELRSEMRDGFAKQQRINESVLNVLNSIEGRLKDMAYLPARVEDHEQRIAILERQSGYPK